MASTGRTVLAPADSTIAGLERMEAAEDSSLQSSEGAMGVFPNPQLSSASHVALLHGQWLHTAESAVEEKQRIPSVISSPGELRLSKMINSATR